MRINSISLLKAGVLQTIIMAIYHFYLPYQFHWEGYLEQKSPTINWSLFSLNSYFSFNVLVLSLVLSFYLFKRREQKETIKALTLITLLFWGYSFFYQIIYPMPLPENLKWIGVVLLGLAFVNGLLFLIPLITFNRSTK